MLTLVRSDTFEAAKKQALLTNDATLHNICLKM